MLILIDVALGKYAALIGEKSQRASLFRKARRATLVTEGLTFAGPPIAIVNTTDMELGSVAQVRTLGRLDRVLQTCCLSDRCNCFSTDRGTLGEPSWTIVNLSSALHLGMVVTA